jgi:hypothetical protein
MRHALATGVVATVVSLGATAWAQTADEVLARFDQEPTVIQVQEATATYNHIEQDVISGWTTRANLAPLLPHVRVDWRRFSVDNLQNTFNQSYDVLVDGTELLTGIDRDQRTQNNDQDQWRVQGDWELRDLIFNPDLLRVSNERSDLVELREDILTTVTTLYFQRRRAQVQMVMDPPADAVERLRRELELQELTAGIDALTGGWFSQQLSAAGLPAY